LTWDDRVSFVLTEGLQLKKVELLGVVLEDKPDESGFDADVAIATGELSKLIPDLIDAIGGEGRTELGTLPQASALAPCWLWRRFTGPDLRTSRRTCPRREQGQHFHGAAPPPDRLQPRRQPTASHGAPGHRLQDG